jgi:hypothetical protein
MNPTNENGRVATQPNPDYQNAQQDFNEDALRQQALSVAVHLRVPVFNGAKASIAESELVDITPLFYRQSTAANPAIARPKTEAWAIIPCNEMPLTRKGYEPSRYVMLMGDVDGGDHSAGDVLATVVAFAEQSIGAIYSTSSSLPDGKRWRVMIPLAQPLGHEQWAELQKAMSHHFAQAGITLDSSMERAAQIAFLPNVPYSITDKAGQEIATRYPDGTPIHFEHHRTGSRLLDAQALPMGVWGALQAVREEAKAHALRQQELAAERERKRVEREAQRQQAIAAGGDGLTVMERFNLAHDTSSLMQQYGYIESPDKPGHWRSPLQTTGSFATELRIDGSWFSLSGSDKDAGLGTPQKGGVGGDAFDLFAHYSHGGDKRAAVKAAAQLLGMPPGGKSTQADVSAFQAVPLPEGVLPFGGSPVSTSPPGGYLAHLTGQRNSVMAFDHSGDGKGFTASRGNLEKALLADDFCHRVAFDSFKSEVMVCEPGETVWRPLRDTDAFNVAVCLESKGFKTVSRETIRDAIAAIAERNAFDSAAQWLEGLAWDGVPRVDEFLAKGFATEAGAYQRAISRYVWTALAGRIICPGVKADMAPVAVGAQGCRKSSAVVAMAPKQEFFAELDLSLDEADLYRAMKGKLVLELGELAGMRRKEAEHLKRFVAATHNVWVEKWQTAATSYARRSIFFGTTNEESFLSDPTGSRRWLPFNSGVTGNCDPDWIAANREQLFAEGAHLYNAHGVLFAEAEQLAKAVHDDYAATDPWDDIIEAWANRVGFDGVAPSSKPIAVSDVLRLGLGLTTAQIHSGVKSRAGASLKRLSYKRVQRRIEGRPVWFYVKPS